MNGYSPLRDLARIQILFVQAAKIAPKIKESETHHKKREELLENDKDISQAAQEIRDILAMKVVRNNS